MRRIFSADSIDDKYKDYLFDAIVHDLNLDFGEIQKLEDILYGDAHKEIEDYENFYNPNMSIASARVVTGYTSDPLSVARGLEDILVDAETGRWDISEDKKEDLYRVADILYNLSNYDGVHDPVSASQNIVDGVDICKLAYDAGLKLREIESYIKIGEYGDVSYDTLNAIKDARYEVFRLSSIGKF